MSTDSCFLCPRARKTNIARSPKCSRARSASKALSDRSRGWATGENVVFSFVIWPDKATRDAGWEKIMADPEMQPGAMEMPFDGKRMFWGGFNPIVNTLEK